MKPSRLFLSILPIACAANLWATPARAQSSKTMADARFHEGMAFLQAGQYEDARLAFAQAYAISHDATTFWNLSVCEMKTNHLVESSKHIREYLQRPDRLPKNVSDAPALLQQMYPSVAHLRVDAPAGATIAIDDQQLEQKAPLGDLADVAAGDHTVRAVLGSQSKETHVHAENGVETPVKIVFDAASTTEPPKTETRSVMFPPPTGAIILGGVGLVGLGLGVGFALDSQSKKSDFDNGNCTHVASSACNDAHSGVATASTVSIASYIAGGALLAGGVVWWIVAPRKETRSVAVRPLAGPSGSGLSVSGTF